MRVEKVEVKVEICREGAVVPRYARPGDAGMDVFAAEEVVIGPGQTRVVPTGLKLAIPEGYEIQVRPRSGISLNTPLRISNSPGTIDSGYRDEVGIIITNTSPPGNGFPEDDSGDGCCSNSVSTKGNIPGTYVIKKGDRIAQFVLMKVPRIEFNIVESVSDVGENRGGGFGSTGV